MRIEPASEIRAGDSQMTFTDWRSTVNNLPAVKKSRLNPTIPAPTLFWFSARIVPTTMSCIAGGRSRTIIFWT